MNKTVLGLSLFIVGLCIALAAAALLFLHIIESGVAALIGILGIGLLGVAGAVFASRRLRSPATRTLSPNAGGAFL